MKKWLVLALICCLLAPAAVTAQDSKTQITLWYHSGQAGEREEYEVAIADFNALSDEYEIVHEIIPQGSYNDEVKAASLAGELPCVLDLDGLNTQAFAASGDLLEIGGLLSDDLMNDLLPSIITQGTYDGGLYSVGQYDSNVGIWANLSYLEQAGVRIPTVDEPWDQAEFDAALEALAEVVPDDGYVIDFNFSGADDGWFFYVLTPWLWSYGGDVVDRSDFSTAQGFINGTEAVEFGEYFQSLFDRGLATATPVDGHQDFREGRAALSAPGHWMYRSYKEALGDDLILLPQVDFGTGPKTGMGSWAWTVTSQCDHVDGAIEVIEYFMSPERVSYITDRNGAPPAIRSVLEQSELYAEGGDLYTFTQQIEAGWSVPRPGTEFTPAMVTAWGSAIRAIANGEDVQATLDTAAAEIDAAIAAAAD